MDPDASGTISDNHIDAYNYGYGIYCTGGNWTIAGGTVEGAGTNGIRTTGGTLNVSGVTIQNNGSYGVYANDANTTISSCVITGHSYPYMFNAGSHTLSDNTITGNTNLAVACSFIPQSCTWPASWALPIALTSTLSINNSVTLTIGSGVEVRLNNSYLMIGSGGSSTGVLIADGVTFTGTSSMAKVWLNYGSGQQITNCTFNGAYLYLDPDASGTVSDNNIDASNSLYGIYGNGNWTITGGTIEGASNNGIYVYGGTWNISGVTILGSQQGLYVFGSANATAQYCSFVGQTSYGVQNTGTSMVDARYCYWGTSDGPGPVGPGSGSNVSTKVLYNPWLPNTSNPSVPGGLNTIYLDFTYTPPIGSGTSQEHALYVKQYVTDRFVLNNVIFTTSFELPIIELDTTSQVIFGGTYSDPNILGLANSDTGNTNWTDSAFICTEQSLFSTMPNDPNEYKYMLANTSAHEIGHLLGYDYSNAASMPFMNNGFAIQARIMQDLLLGQLGKTTQEKWTYIEDTDLDLDVAKPQVIYIPKTSVTPQQFDTMVQELDDYYDYYGAQTDNAEKIVICSINDVLSLFPDHVAPVAQWSYLGIKTLNNIYHDETLENTARLQWNGASNNLSLNDPDLITIDGAWDPNTGTYLFYTDSILQGALFEGSITVSFLSDSNDIPDYGFISYDHSYNEIGNKYLNLETISPTGDINGDGITDLQDFAVFARHYKETGTYLDRLEGADLNRDEIADIRDLFILAMHWLETAP